MIHVLLPAQYLGRPGQGLVVPQKRLMVAVLQTVLDDYWGSSYRRSAGYGPAIDRKAARQARAYVASTDRDWPFSFENLCEAIGVDADRLREALRLPAPCGEPLLIESPLPPVPPR